MLATCFLLRTVHSANRYASLGLVVVTERGCFAEWLPRIRFGGPGEVGVRLAASAHSDISRSGGPAGAGREARAGSSAWADAPNAYPNEYGDWYNTDMVPAHWDLHQLGLGCKWQNSAILPEAGLRATQ